MLGSLTLPYGLSDIVSNGWHVSSAVNCIFSVMQRTMQFSSSTERDLIEIELPVLCAVMQKLQHSRMCQSICVAFTDSKRDHFCAD